MDFQHDIDYNEQADSAVLNTSNGRPKWYIENPHVKPSSDLTYLCNTCRHLCFSTLLESTNHSLPRVNLGPLAHIVEKKNCAFCRLVVQTICIENNVRPPVTEIGGKAILCTLGTYTQVRGQSGFSSTRALALFPEDNTSSYQIHMIGEKPFEGREVIRSQADFALIRQRLALCERDDSRGQKNDFEEGADTSPGRLNVVDVNDSCITIIHGPCRYLALSYRWGGIKQFMCTKANRAELAKKNSLLAIEGLIPQTVRDAMSLVAQIGERYLWVDSLCIVQDDEDMKRTQIAAMGQIYNSAVLTIAATNGDVGAGLPGVRAGSRNVQQHVEELQGLRLTNKLPGIARAVDYSVWNTRAWTFQERLLARRTLLISNWQMYWSCSHENFAEDIRCAHGIVRARESPLGNGSGYRCPQLYYYNNQLVLISKFSWCQALSGYGVRTMSYTTDILRAFEGIISIHKPLFRGDFIYGLPETELDWGLLWRPAKASRQRIDPDTNRPLFPSWSWAGWISPRGYYLLWQQPLFSRILWRDLSVHDESKQWFSSDDYRSPKDIGPGFAKNWERTHGGYKEQGGSGVIFGNPTALENDRTTRKRVREGSSHLEFRTLSASFYITKKHCPKQEINGAITECSHENCTLYLFIVDGKCGGAVGLPGSIAKSLESGKHEFILLSRTAIGRYGYWKDQDPPNESFPNDFEERHRYPDENDSSNEEGCNDPPVNIESFGSNLHPEHLVPGYGFDKRCFDEHKPWCMYNVMMIEKKDGVAYRLGLGSVHIDAFFAASPKWKHIVLG